jgi:hypothetical protein
MAIPYQQETLFLNAEQMTILSCSNGLVLGEMRGRQHQTIMTSRDMQSHIGDMSITNDGYIGAQSTEGTYVNQPLFRTHLLGLGRMALGIHMS